MLKSLILDNFKNHYHYHHHNNNKIVKHIPSVLYPSDLWLKQQVLLDIEKIFTATPSPSPPPPPVPTPTPPTPLSPVVANPESKRPPDILFKKRSKTKVLTKIKSKTTTTTLFPAKDFDEPLLSAIKSMEKTDAIVKTRRKRTINLPRTRE